MSDSLARSPTPPLADTAALVAVDRATAELRRGGLVLVTEAAGRAALVLAAETADAGSLGRLRQLAEGSALLGLTAQRAAAFGTPPGGPGDSRRGVVTFPLPAGAEASLLRRLADPTADGETMAGLPLLAAWSVGPRTAGAAAAFAAAGVELAKLARLLPAVVIGPLPALEPPARLAGWAAEQDLLWLRAEDAALYQTVASRSLRRVGEARVPLAGADEARILAFRPSDGGIEHLAILIGEPDPAAPVLTRLHSECFTGDLLGSLRCDCGDQLRGAIAEIGRHGSGVLLYLAQEGRGIGLVNKLRAYRLQDAGADTVEANLQLGFEADERLYLPAAEMLRQLGYLQVRLMTNNPEKVAGLTRCGIAVTERVAHVFPANGHNERYLSTKAARCGHIF